MSSEYVIKLWSTSNMIQEIKYDILYNQEYGILLKD